MKAVVAAFNQEKALVGAFSVITNLRMELFEALEESDGESCGPGSEADPPAAGCQARFTRSFNWNLKRGLGAGTAGWRVEVMVEVWVKLMGGRGGGGARRYHLQLPGHCTHSSGPSCSDLIHSSETRVSNASKH